MVLAITTTETSLLVHLIVVTLYLCATVGFFISLWLAVDGSMKLSCMNSEFRSGALGRNGQIRLDEFAIRSDVHIAIARWYLNSKARQLGGLREVDDVGESVYLFGEAKRNFLRFQMALLSADQEHSTSTIQMNWLENNVKNH